MTDLISSAADTREVRPAGPEPAVRERRRPELDGLRGLAVLFTLVSTGGLLTDGSIGIDVFFTLSGFLLTDLLYAEWRQQGRISLKRFYLRRARQLVPVVAILAVALVVLHEAGLKFHYAWSRPTWPTWKLVLAGLSMTSNWLFEFTRTGASDLGAMASLWTVATGVQFFLVWPFVLLFLLRRQVSLSRIGLGLIAAIAVLTLAVPFAWHVLPHYSQYYSPLDRYAELLVGAFAAILLRWDGTVHFALPRFVGWLAFGYLLLDLSGASTLPVRGTFLTACLAAAILLLHLYQVDDGLLAEVFRFDPLRFLGRISLAVYLFELPVDMCIKRYLSHYSWPGSSGVNVILLGAITIPLAFLAQWSIRWSAQRIRPPATT